MPRTIHVGLSVRGALSNRETLRELCGCIMTDDGKTLTTPQAVFEFLCDQLSQGREILPFGQCDAWDWKTGCAGHEVTPA